MTENPVTVPASDGIPAAAAPEDETTYCEKHPDRETSLRCNKCGRLMCSDCAVLTPVGYRCKECVRGIQAAYFNATPQTTAITVAAVAALAAVAVGIEKLIGLPLFFLILLGLPIGGAIAELGVRASQKQRARSMPQLAAAGAVLGGLVGALVVPFFQLSNAMQQLARAGREVAGFPLEVLLQRSLFDLSTILFIALIAVAVYGRFRMRG
jgi:hypothetical protein